MSRFLLRIRLDPTPAPPPPVLAGTGACEIAVPGGMLFIAGPNVDVVEQTPVRVRIRHGELLRPEEDAEVRALSDEPTAEWARHRGTFVRVRAEPFSVAISTDLLGSFPVYYWRSAAGDEVVIGSSLGDVRAISGMDIDLLGAYQYLTKGYTYGSRTAATGVSQLRAAEILEVRRGADGLSISTRTEASIWAGHATARAVDVLEELVETWRWESGKLISSLLMISGGWDSRTLLAGVMAAHNQGAVIAYSHGNVEGREIRIAAAASGIAGVTHVARPVNPACFSAEAAQRILHEVDTFLFPHWWDAGAYAAEHGMQCITGGVYGELLGGHSSVPFLATRDEGSKALLRYLFGRLDPANGSLARVRSRVVDLLDDRKYFRLWCMSEDWHRSVEGWAAKGVREDLEAAVDRYAAFGIDNVEQLVEAFVVDHRNRQYTNAQVRAAAHRVRAVNPFTSPRLLELVARLPLTEKIHNDLNRRLLGVIAPRLLRLPMAATLVPARYPVLVQEFSRLARKILEAAADIASRASGGRFKGPNLSWVDFEFLRSDRSLSDLVDSLELPIWNRPLMHAAVRAGTASTHSMFDMLAKCKTLDYHLTAG